MPPVAILVIAVLVVVVLIVRLRMHAFVALIAASALIGLLSDKVPISDVMRETAQRFGTVVGNIGIAIAMATIVGECLMQSGAADKIVRRFVAWIGEKRSSLSLIASGYVLGVPVFFDTVFYLLVPLARAMSVRMGGARYVLLALSISAGGAATHVFVPPTPGPLVMASTLGVDVGLVILVGLAVAMPASLAGWLYANWIDRKLGIEIREAPGLSLAEMHDVAAKPESELPGFWVSITPILLPVLLISSNTIANTLDKQSAFARVTSLLGDPNFSLMFSAAVSLWILASHKRLSFRDLGRTVETAIGSAGSIILITAAGGAFGGMLVKAGIGDTLSAMAKSFGLTPLLLGFLLAALFKLAQGSSTVAMITVSALLAEMIIAAPLPYNPVYLVMAIGAGSLVGQWMNDSGFWVFRTMTGLTEIETLRTKSTTIAIMGTTAMIVAYIGSVLFPLNG
ncbi:MAG: hypothetical protein KIT57_00245 [Blastocatellales bacterium]|nr:hypothetical protein [Blastocatellales bacterium]